MTGLQLRYYQTLAYAPMRSHVRSMCRITNDTGVEGYASADGGGYAGGMSNRLALRASATLKSPIFGSL